MITGIDIGFSETRKTSCYCSFYIDDVNKTISFLHKPERFGVNHDIQSHLVGTHIITVDASITPKLIIDKPKTGRKIEKLFSNGIFSNSPYRGPQPSSIAVPKQGWGLYQAGMQVVSSLFPFQYLLLSDIQTGKRKGIYEVLPKLIQSLLVPREIVANRDKQLDDYLFPLLFSSDGKFRNSIDSILGDYRFDNEVQEYINTISINPKKYHEELAAVICSFQGVLIHIGKASFIGFAGDYEGYYALPQINYWDLEWYNCYMELIKKKFTDAVVI